MKNQFDHIPFEENDDADQTPFDNEQDDDAVDAQKGFAGNREAKIGLAVLMGLLLIFGGVITWRMTSGGERESLLTDTSATDGAATGQSADGQSTGTPGGTVQPAGAVLPASHVVGGQPSGADSIWAKAASGQTPGNSTPTAATSQAIDTGYPASTDPYGHASDPNGATGYADPATTGYADAGGATAYAGRGYADPSESGYADPTASTYPDASTDAAAPSNYPAPDASTGAAGYATVTEGTARYHVAAVPGDMNRSAEPADNPPFGVQPNPLRVTADRTVPIDGSGGYSPSAANPSSQQSPYSQAANPPAGYSQGGYSQDVYGQAGYGQTNPSAGTGYSQDAYAQQGAGAAAATSGQAYGQQGYVQDGYSNDQYGGTANASQQQYASGGSQYGSTATTPGYGQQATVSPRYGTNMVQVVQPTGQSSNAFGGPMSGGRYKVRPLENYWKISENVYGTGAYFRALAECNRRAIPREDELAVGDVIVTPSIDSLERDYPDLCPRRERRQSLVRQASLSSLPDPTPGPGERLYIVQPGDSLFDIARFELDDVSRYMEVYERNRDTIGDDFNYVVPGMKLILPARRLRGDIQNMPDTPQTITTEPTYDRETYSPDTYYRR